MAQCPGSTRAPDRRGNARSHRQHVTAFREAEHRVGLARDIVAPSLLAPATPGLAAAQRALGETLFDLLDGPSRALARRLEDAWRDGATLHLVVRLRAADRKTLAQHPALAWHLQLIAAPEGPLALAPNVAIAVQLGDADITARETVPGGRLQVLFMAYSPRDVHPVLDYEAEEERILGELAPFVEERRLVLKVAEDGSLDELKRRLMRRAYDVVHLTGHGVVTPRGPDRSLPRRSAPADLVDRAGLERDRPCGRSDRQPLHQHGIDRRRASRGVRVPFTGPEHDQSLTRGHADRGYRSWPVRHDGARVRAGLPVPVAAGSTRAGHTRLASSRIWC